MKRALLLFSLLLASASLAAPLPKVRIMIKTPDGETIEVLTNKQGHFEAPGLDKGNYVLTLKPGRVENLLGDFVYTEAVDVRTAQQGEPSRFGMIVALEGKKSKPSKFSAKQVSEGISIKISVEKNGKIAGTLSSD